MSKNTLPAFRDIDDFIDYCITRECDDTMLIDTGIDEGELAGTRVEDLDAFHLYLMKEVTSLRSMIETSHVVSITGARFKYNG